MEAPEQNDLEKFIHAQLRKLPDRPAPDALVNNVLAAISRRQKLPWWKQPFTFWPKQVQVLLFAALGSLAAAAVYAATHAAAKVPVPDVAEKLSSYAWVWRGFRSISEALVLAVSSLPVQWLAAIGCVFLLFYGACIAAGFALFRVTAAAGAHA